jgi:hypothetical protein
LLPVVFDDTREDGIRSSLGEWFKLQSDGVEPCETDSGATKAIERAIDNGKPASKKPKQPTTADKTEEALDKFLSNSSMVWKERGNVRGTMFYHLYLLRNRVFGITPSSIRRKIPSRYAKNMQALETMIQLCDCMGSKVLVYVPPLRADAPAPYDISEYESFKDECRKLCSSNSNIRYLDLQQVVPDKFWGQKESTSGGSEKELDFMHFQSAGHRLLAERLHEEVRKCLETNP